MPDPEPDKREHKSKSNHGNDDDQGLGVTFIDAKENSEKYASCYEEYSTQEFPSPGNECHKEESKPGQGIW